MHRSLSLFNCNEHSFDSLFWLARTRDSKPRLSTPIYGTRDSSNSEKLERKDDEIRKDVDHVPGFTFLKEEDFRNAVKVDERKVIYNTSGMYAHDKFEGDIVLKNGHTRSMIAFEDMLWPDRRIPYVMSEEFTSSQRAVIAKAIMIFHQHTCIRFQPKGQYDKAYLSLERLHDGCYTTIGRDGRNQTVSLDEPCVFVGVVQHELMHAMGFYHEQSRFDRDKYIDILWNNIQPEMRSQFKIATRDEMDAHGFGYDLKSVMHYDSMAFAKEKGKPTMLTKRGEIIRPAKVANENDFRKINKLYKCRG